jgi:GrpB-like predicted nucleotidyltransferase (UPF0157 family)
MGIMNGEHMSDTPKQELETGLIGGLEKRVIEIVPYRSDWPSQFRCHAERIKNALGGTALRIEHIGSTSVEGLAAKPIIDILVVVSDPAKEALYLPEMLSAGYELRVREPEFEEHRMFRTPERDIHVHFYPVEFGEIERYLLFRNFLRTNPEARDNYAALKHKLSNKGWADMNEYADAKTALIEDIIRQARNN